MMHNEYHDVRGHRVKYSFASASIFTEEHVNMGEKEEYSRVTFGLIRIKDWDYITRC